MPSRQKENLGSRKEFVTAMGEEKTFEFFFQQYYTALCFFARSILHNEEESKDIVQDCFIKLLDNRSMNERSDTVKSFLYTAVHNRCIDLIRKKKVIRKAKLEIVTGSPEDEITFYDELANAEMIRLVLERVGELPEETQQIIKLYYVHGKKNREIAEEVDSTEEAVRKQKARALQSIREKFLFLFWW